MIQIKKPKYEHDNYCACCRKPFESSMEISFSHKDFGDSTVITLCGKCREELKKALEGKDTNVHSNDCIDRAEAQTAIQFAARRYIVAHEAHGEGKVVWSENLINVTDAMNALRDLPSAQPKWPETAKRIVGHSRNGTTMWYECDRCGQPVDKGDCYCSSCGRRLEDGGTS